MNILKNMEKYEAKYKQKETLKKEYKSILNKHKNDIIGLNKDLNYARDATDILKLLSNNMINNLKVELNSIVNFALSDIFEEPPIFDIDFVEKRNKIEADIFLIDCEGNKINPLDNSAGGVVDILSFALQVTLWNLQNPRSRAVLVLDEPLKWLKGNDYPEKGAQLIKSLSDKLGIQIIMVSHSPELIDCADNIIEVYKENNISYIKNTP